MILLAADHAGFQLKEKLKDYFRKKGVKFLDLGTNSEKPVDYPPIASKVCRAILKVPTPRRYGGRDPDRKRREKRGILVCGSGQGMAMVANRFKGIRAAVCWNQKSALETRKDNDSNVLSLPARLISEKTAFGIVETWLKTPFSKAPRHQRRIAQIDQ